MSVILRLTRTGAKKKAFYRLVAADSRFPRDGRFIEVLGTYNPNLDPPAIKLNREKVETWVNRGAHLSPTVKSLLKKADLHQPAKKSPPAAKAGGSQAGSPA
jgi:small subunit ribosomal protein S16